MEENKEEISGENTPEINKTTTTPKVRKPRATKSTKIVVEKEETNPGIDEKQEVVSTETDLDSIISEEFNLEELFLPIKEKTKKALSDFKLSTGTELYSRFNKGFVRDKNTTAEDNERISSSEFLFNKLKF